MSLHDILRELASRTPFADETARQQVLSAIDEHERQAATVSHEEPRGTLPVTGTTLTRTPPVPPIPPSPEGM